MLTTGSQIKHHLTIVYFSCLTQNTHTRERDLHFIVATWLKVYTKAMLLGVALEVALLDFRPSENMSRRCSVMMRVCFNLKKK